VKVPGHRIKGSRQFGQFAASTNRDALLEVPSANGFSPLFE